MGFLEFLKKKPESPALHTSEEIPLPPQAPFAPPANESVQAPMPDVNFDPKPKQVQNNPFADNPFAAAISPIPEQKQFNPFEKHEIAQESSETHNVDWSSFPNPATAEPVVTEPASPVPPKPIVEPSKIEIPEQSSPVQVSKEEPTLPPPTPAIPAQPSITSIAKPEHIPVQPVLPPAAQPSTPPPITSLMIPDFSAEDLAAVDEPLPKPTAPALPEFNEEIPARPVLVDVQKPAPKPEPVVVPKETVQAPEPVPKKVEPPAPQQYLSYENHVMMLNEIKNIRKSVRQHDDAVKDVISKHEQLEQLHRKIASESNAVQEHIMRIDNALFEE